MAHEKQTVTAYLTIQGAEEAIAFYGKVFGAVELFRMTCPQTGKLGHVDLQIGNSRIYLSEEFPEMGGPSPTTLGGTTVSIHLYTDDVDATFARAVEAGAKPLMPPADMFWGDRFAKVSDPFGHNWSIAQQVEVLTPEQMQERVATAFAGA